MAFKSLGTVDEQQRTFVISSTKEVNDTGGLWSGLNEIQSSNVGDRSGTHGRVKKCWIPPVYANQGSTLEESPSF